MIWSALMTAALAGDGAWPELPAPNVGSGGDGSHDAAVVIAIEDYLLAPDVPEARKNGMAWVDWLATARKVPTVKPIFDAYATREQILADVAAISGEVDSNGRLWVVFIGHGAPTKDGKDGLLEGADVQQNAMSIEARGVRRTELQHAIEENLRTNASAVVVLDACFSGQTASGELAPKLAPMRDVSFAPSERVTFLTAAANNEYAGPLSDGSRPAFSYLVLGAMRGWSDNGDGKIMASEAVAYSKRALMTTIMGRQQTPSLSGTDVVLALAKTRDGPNLSALTEGYVRTAPYPPQTPDGSGVGAASPPAAANAASAWSPPTQPGTQPAKPASPLAPFKLPISGGGSKTFNLSGPIEKIGLGKFVDQTDTVLDRRQILTLADRTERGHVAAERSRIWQRVGWGTLAFGVVWIPLEDLVPPQGVDGFEAPLTVAMASALILTGTTILIATDTSRVVPYASAATE